MRNIKMIGLLLACSMFAQEEPRPELRTRGAWNLEFQRAREAAQKAQEATPPTTQATATESEKKKTDPPKTTVAGAGRKNLVRPGHTTVKENPPVYIGMTLWGLQRDSGGPATRGLVQVNPGEKMAAKRLDMNSAVREHERVRLSIEASREGYLYIIDQDVFADGTKSEATLLFPTARIRNGNNQVRAGRPVEIPAPTDPGPAFEVVKTRDNQTGILVYALWSETPIAELSGADDAQPVSASSLEHWQKLAVKPQPSPDDPTQIGAYYTKAEELAGKGQSELGSKAPVPQVLFQGHPRGNSPILVTYKIPIKAETGSK